MKPDPLRAEALFLAAAEITEPRERSAFLDRECGEDLGLRARVDGLLASHDEAGGFLQPTEPSPELEAEFARLKPEEAGERIGHYKLLQHIGEGGFGVVWMAEQELPVRRRVALKIIKLGMDTKEVIARFEQERQALAMMDHPNIAKVFDAGATPFGRPFFVMELVRGIRITDFCDQASLPTADRLQLFIAVCQAVQHAHQKGIIHRDLKPSNILVTLHDGVPVPKVIDFGVAKATQGPLTDKTLFTQFEQMIGTPLYMSPEQAELSGLDIDTRTDIYALGVVLYELLTGRTPVDAESLRSAGFDEMRRIIREQEPLRPSLARSRGAVAPSGASGRGRPEFLSTDLDWIVMKALEKDRTRRYETANGLAMDVQRHLDNEPILARPPSTGYRLRKMVRRNKLAFAAGGAIALALLAGIAVSTLQAIRAARAEGVQAVLREKAEASEQKVVEKAEATRRALARADLALADGAFHEHDGLAMRAALDRVPEDLRDSNWHYLLAHTDTSLATLRVSKDGEVSAAAAHPKRAGVFAITNAHGYVALVEARTGARLLEFRAGLKTVTTSSSDTRTEAMAFSPDGGRIAIGQTGPGLVIHSALDGRKVVEWDTPRTTRLEFSPDGRQLLQVCAEQQQINLWDAATGQLAWTCQASAPAVKAAFTAGGQTIAFCSTADKLRLLNVLDGSLNREFPNRSGIAAIAMHRDGRRMFTAEPIGRVSGWDLRDGSLLFETQISGLSVMDMVLTDEGARFVTLSVQNVGKQSIDVWDATSRAHLQTLLGASASAAGLCIHPLSGELITTRPLAKSWCLANPPAKWRFLVNSFELAFWGAEDLVLTSDSLLDLAAGTPAAPSVLWRAERGGDRYNQNLTVSGDGRTAAIGRIRTAAGVTDANIQLLQRAGQTVEAGRVLTFRGNLRAMRLTASGDRLAVFTKNVNVIVEPATGAERARLDMNGIGFAKDAVWVDGDTRLVGLVTAKKERGFPGAEEQIVLWDAATGQRLQTVPCATPGNRLAVSPDGRTIAEAGADKMVRLRDARSLAITRQFRAHDAPITALAWHPTRPILATGSEDLTVKLWDLDPLKLIEERRGPEATLRSVAFSPTGRRLACLSMAARAFVWEPESLKR